MIDSSRNTFFSMVSPVFNEENTIRELVDRIIKSFHDSGLLFNKRWEFLLVDDGSSDQSFEVILQLMRKYPGLVKGIRHKRNYGQGQALKTGFYCAEGTIIGMIDSDLEKLPEDMPKLLKEFLEKDCDIVCSFIKNKNLVSRVGNCVCQFLFKYKAKQVGANQMVVHSRFVHRVNFVGNDQRYFLPIAVSLGAIRIGEVLTSYTPRKYNKSNYNIYIKMIQGIPEMLLLKQRIKKNFYSILVSEEYSQRFEIIPSTQIHS